jgi:hypothetical protein
MINVSRTTDSSLASITTLFLYTSQRREMRRHYILQTPMGIPSIYAHRSTLEKPYNYGNNTGRRNRKDVTVWQNTHRRVFAILWLI